MYKFFSFYFKLLIFIGIISNIYAKNKINRFLLTDEYSITVSKDGSADYINLQDAIDNCPSFPYKRVVIYLKNGVYFEKVRVPEWNTLISIIGESKEQTIITFDDYFNKNKKGRNSTFDTYTLLIEGNDFFASNLTIINLSGEKGQAIALNCNANRSFFLNCAIIGNQDTLYVSGEGFKNYFKDCYVEGTTDFIFGQATTLFENCIINSKKNSYITAASTPKDIEFGFVFKDCKLTAIQNIDNVYLGRPWRIYAQTVFLNCEMGNHIATVGWNNWSKPGAEKTSFYAEYNCFGAGYKPEKRVSWSNQLNAESAKKFSNKNILGALFFKNTIELSVKTN